MNIEKDTLGDLFNQKITPISKMILQNRSRC